MRMPGETAQDRWSVSAQSQIAADGTADEKFDAIEFVGDGASAGLPNIDLDVGKMVSPGVFVKLGSSRHADFAP